MKKKEYSKEELLKHVEETQDLIKDLKAKKDSLNEEERAKIDQILAKIEAELPSEKV